MKILSIAYYTALKYLRNIVIVIFLVAAPVVTMYLTSNFSDVDKIGTSSLEKAAFYSEKNESMTDKLKSILNTDKLKDKIKLINVKSYNEGIRAIDNYDADSFIYVKDSSHIKLYYTKKASACNIVLSSFVNSSNTAYTIISMRKNPQIKEYSNLKNINIINNSNKVIDDVAIANLLTFIFYGSLLTAYTFMNDSKKKTALRHNAAPLRYIQNYLGKSIGCIFVMLSICFFTILISKYLLHVNWNGNYGMIFIAFLLFLIIANCIGIILSSIFKNIYMSLIGAFAINFPLVYPVMQNAYAPGTTTGFDIVSVISPHNYTFRLISSNISGNLNTSGNSLIILVFMAVILLGISWIAGRRICK